MTDGPATTPLERWVAFFEHIDRYHRLYGALLGSNGSPWFARRMRATLADDGREHFRQPSGRRWSRRCSGHVPPGDHLVARHRQTARHRRSPPGRPGSPQRSSPRPTPLPDYIDATERALSGTRLHHAGHEHTPCVADGRRPRPGGSSAGAEFSRHVTGVARAARGTGDRPDGVGELRPDGDEGAGREGAVARGRGADPAVIGQTFPLEQAADAHAAITARSALGKTLLVV